MDKSTHEIRLSNWKAVIEQCSLRPAGQTVKQWLAEAADIKKIVIACGCTDLRKKY